MTMSGHAGQKRLSLLFKHVTSFSLICKSSEFEQYGQYHRRTLGLLIKHSRKLVAYLVLDCAAVKASLAGVVLDYLGNDGACLVHHRLGVAHIDEAARNDARTRHDMTGLAVYAGDGYYQTVLTEALAVAKHDASDVADAETVDKHSAAGHSAYIFYAVLIDLDTVAEVGDEDVLVGNTHRRGERRVLLQVLLLAVDGNEEARLGHSQHYLQLLLTGVTGDVYLVHLLIYDLAAVADILLGQLGYYNELTGEGMVTDSALAKDFSQSLTDTLFIHADTLRLYTFHMGTDSMYRKIHGYYHVRAYRSDMQAVADSLVGHSTDHTLTLYKDPIVWNANRQILGEVITGYTNDSTIDSVYVDRQALLVEQVQSSILPDTIFFYNQVAGRQMRAYYRGKQLHENVVDGNGLVVYYPFENDSSILYQIYMETARINVIYNDEGQLDSLRTPAGDGMMYPLGMAPDNHTFLPNFAWFDYIRPRDKYDLFEWRPKRAGSELKFVARRQAPVQYLKKDE